MQRGEGTAREVTGWRSGKGSTDPPRSPGDDVCTSPLFGTGSSG
jgi:hypothetical protein